MRGRQKWKRKREERNRWDLRGLWDYRRVGMEDDDGDDRDVKDFVANEKVEEEDGGYGDNADVDEGGGERP